MGNKTIFEEVLTSNESISIEGTVKGKVECKGSVVVGKEGKVKAKRAGLVFKEARSKIE